MHAGNDNRVPSIGTQVPSPQIRHFLIRFDLPGQGHLSSNKFLPGRAADELSAALFVGTAIVRKCASDNASKAKAPSGGNGAF